MNWVGGARNRLKFQGDRRLQKEFFERKKLDQKVEKLQKASYCHSSKKKKLSQDLVALHSVSNASVKAGNSPRSAKVQHIDLKRHHHGVAGLPRRSSALGSHLSRIPESVELPFSPDHFPSKLQLKEPDKPSTGGKGNDARIPNKRKNTEPSSPRHGLMPDLNPVTLTTPKSKAETFHTPKRMRTQYSPHWRPASQSLSDRQASSTASTTSDKKTQGFLALSSTLQPDTKCTGSWVQEDSKLVKKMKKIQEKFQSPLCVSQEFGIRDPQRTPRAGDNQNWTPYKYPFGLQHPEDLCSRIDDLGRKEHRHLEHSSHKTPVHHHRTENYKGSQSSLNTIWTRKDSRMGFNEHLMAVSPVKIPAQTTPQFSLSSSAAQGNLVDSPCVRNNQSYKDVQTGAKPKKDGNKAMSIFDDHLTPFSSLKNMFQPSTEGMKTEKQSSHLKHSSLMKSSIFHDFEKEDYQLKLKRLWLPEDFQPSPHKPNQKKKSETSQLSLSEYTPVFRKPPISKWETFLGSPDKACLRLDVPQTPPPTFWKTLDAQKYQTNHVLSLSEPRTASDQVPSSYSAREMRNHSDSGTSSTHRQKSKIKSTANLHTLEEAGISSRFQSRSAREGVPMLGSSMSGSEEPEPFDWRPGFWAYRRKKSQDTQDTSGSDHTSESTSSRIGLTTPISNMLKQQTPKQHTPKRWPRGPSHSEEILREYKELHTQSTTDQEIMATKRQTLPQSLNVACHLETPLKVLKMKRDLRPSHTDHDAQADVKDTTHCTRHSTPALNQSTDSKHNDQPSQPGSIPDSEADKDDFKESLQSSFSTQSSELEDSLDLDTSVVESDECSDAESDPDTSVQDAVESLVHQVVMQENKNSMADVHAADRAQLKTLWSASEKLDNRSTDAFPCEPPTAVMNSNRPGNGGESQSNVHPVSVHVQTEWTLLHVDIPSNWSPGAPAAAKAGQVDQGTQWEPPSTQLCDTDIQPRLETIRPASEPQSITTSASEEQTQIEPELASKDMRTKEAEEVVTLARTLILSPRQSSKSSSHSSLTDCQETPPVIAPQNISDTALSVSREKVNISDTALWNDSMDSLKKPDIRAGSVTAKNMQILRAFPQNAAAKNMNTTQLATKNLPEKMDKPKKSPMNLPTKKVDISKLLPKAQTQTETNTSQPENPQSNKQNTELQHQDTFPKSEKLEESPNVDSGSGRHTEKEQELRQQKDASTLQNVDVTKCSQTIPEQAVADSSSSPSGNNIPASEACLNKEHCSNQIEGEIVTHAEYRTQETSKQNPTQESSSTDSLSLSVKKDRHGHAQAPLICSSSDTDHSNHAAYNVTTSTVAMESHPEPVDNPNDSTENMNSQLVDTVTTTASTDIHPKGSTDSSPAEPNAESNGSGIVPKPAKESSNLNACDVPSPKNEEEQDKATAVSDASAAREPGNEMTQEQQLQRQKGPPESLPNSDGGDHNFLSLEEACCSAL